MLWAFLYTFLCAYVFNSWVYTGMKFLGQALCFNFMLVIWSKQMSRYKIGYCSELQLKNSTAFSPSFLSLREEGLISGTGHLDVSGRRAWRQLQQVLICSGDLEWVTVLPACLLFRPWCLLPTALSFCPHLQPGPFLSLFSGHGTCSSAPHPHPSCWFCVPTCPGPFQGWLAFHFAFITCCSAMSVCLTWECRRWIFPPLFPPCPSWHCVGFT